MVPLVGWYPHSGRGSCSKAGRESGSHGAHTDTQIHTRCDQLKPFKLPGSCGGLRKKCRKKAAGKKAVIGAKRENDS